MSIIVVGTGKTDVKIGVSGEDKQSEKGNETMTLEAPYFGQDVSELEVECSLGLQSHFQSAPVEDLGAFNPAVKSYGVLWTDLCDKVDGVFVIAGVAGNMTGVPVARFDYQHRDAARRYAAAFQCGKVFTVMNDERWCDYVNAAHDARPIDSDCRQWLISKGRKSGMSLDGIGYSQEQLFLYFVAGGDF